MANPVQECSKAEDDNSKNHFASSQLGSFELGCNDLAFNHIQLLPGIDGFFSSHDSLQRSAGK
jgi:hypothetical protein